MILLFDDFRNAFKSLQQTAALGGDVKADVAFACRRTVHRARIDPHLRFTEQTVAKRLTRHAHGRHIHPGKVGAFKTADSPLRQIFLDEIAQNLIIAPYILVQFVNPVFALVIGRFQGYGAEGIQVADLVDVDGTVESSTPIRP